MKNITKIQPYDAPSWSSIKTKFDDKNCDEIRTIYKNGECALITWFQIIKDNKIIAEIKESVCHIYG